jgi:hypothetical protein
MLAFGDANLKYDLATTMVAYLRKTYDEALAQPLQEETREEDAKFEEAAIALDKLKKDVKE